MAIEGMLIRERREEDNLTLSVIGDILISNAEGLQRRLDEAIDSDAQTIILDVSRVGYIDSFGVGVVVETQSKVDKRHKRFRVLINEPLSRIFLKSHLDGYIDISVKGPVSPEHG